MNDNDYEAVVLVSILTMTVGSSYVFWLWWFQ